MQTETEAASPSTVQPFGTDGVFLLNTDYYLNLYLLNIIYNRPIVGHSVVDLILSLTDILKPRSPIAVSKSRLPSEGQCELCSCNVGWWEERVHGRESSPLYSVFH